MSVMRPEDGEREWFDQWFDRVSKDITASTGLSPVFARGTIQRAIARAGLDMRSMTPNEFDREIRRDLASLLALKRGG